MVDAPSKDDGGRSDGGGRRDRGGIIARLAGLLGAGDDPERERRRLLRENARRVQRSRLRLYNPRSSMADPAMGGLFHGFYRTLGPARVPLRGAAASAVLKAISIERVLSARQREILSDLSDQALQARAQTVEAEELVRAAGELLEEFSRGFDRRAVARARRVHEAVLLLVDLVSYDYWTILRRFDSRYPEADFTYTPRFLPLEAKHLGEALKDFLEVLTPIEQDRDWPQVLDILREFRGTELIGAEAWRGLLRTVGELKKSGLLVAIVRLVDGDPAYAPRPRSAEAQLVEPYVATARVRAEAAVERAVHLKRRQRIEVLAKAVFAGKGIPGLSGYGAAANERLAKSSLPAFAHVAALGYARAYLVEIHKTRMKGLVDTLLIRGSWRETSMSRGVSDAYQGALSVLDGIVELDRSLGDNQELGVKLRAAIARADRAKDQSLVPGRKFVAQIDAMAKGHVVRVLQSCLALAQLFRALVEDAGRQSPQVLSNWPELSGSGKGDDVREDLAAGFGVLQDFVELVRLCTGAPPGS